MKKSIIVFQTLDFSKKLSYQAVPNPVLRSQVEVPGLQVVQAAARLPEKFPSAQIVQILLVELAPPAL